MQRDARGEASGVAVDVRANCVRVGLDARLYPLDVLYGAAYVFLSRAYVSLDRDGAKGFRVTLRGNQPLSRKDLRALAGEFENELVDQCVRARLARQHGKLREMIVGRALFGAQGGGVPPGEIRAVVAADPAASGGDDDYLADPLGIAVPWEEKFLAKKRDGGGDAPADTAPPPAGPPAKPPDVPVGALRRGPGPERWTDRQEYVPFDETAAPPPWAKKE